MTSTELQAKLDELLALPGETEWVEFKEAENNYDFEKLGRYFSALSNEANLKKQPFGWLVFGIRDKPRQVVGSNYRLQRFDLDRLKQEVAGHTPNGLTFEEIHELTAPAGRIILFQVPAASAGVPTSWKGHYYGRNGESLSPLNLQEIEQIRRQAVREDWSAQVCAGANLGDLDARAIDFARTQYKEKNPKIAAEMDGWDTFTFLNKARLAIAGQITRAAIILLGKEEAEHFLSPAQARITWILKDAAGVERDYQHFGPPLLLHVEEVYGKIRNLNYRYLRNASLFPTEITKYDPWVIREALHNSIAHRDYSLGGRINLVEEDDELLLTNLGHFLPETVERVIDQDAPHETYRNPLLTTTMVNLNMIDTIGSGIKRMFRTQRERFFPLPDYDLSDPRRVKVRITGKVLDENYTRILITETDLSLLDAIALDKVQKRMPISDEEFQSLKAKKLIEGRRPNLIVSAKVAIVTGDQSKYIKLRGLDNQHYKKLILSYLHNFGSARRSDIEAFLLDKLPDALTQTQKEKRVGNLLQEMARRDGTIRAEGTTIAASWLLTKEGREAMD